MEGLVVTGKKLEEVLREVEEMRRTHRRVVVRFDSLGKNCHTLRFILDICKPCSVVLHLDRFELSLLNNPFIIQLLEQLTEVFVSGVRLDIRKLLNDFRKARQPELLTIASALTAVV